MDKNDFPKFNEIMLGMSEMLSATITPRAINGYFDVLKGYFPTINHFRERARQIMTTRKYNSMPTPGEFLEGLNGPLEDPAQIEAMNVLRLIRENGADHEPPLEPVVKDLIRARFGGWWALCSTLEESKIQWFIRDFKEAYLSALSDVPAIEHKKPIQIERLKELGNVLKSMEVAI